MGDLKLRRGTGAFLLNGVLLTPDDPDPLVYGTIDFTTRPSAQRLLLATYAPAASTVTGAIIYCQHS